MQWLCTPSSGAEPPAIGDGAALGMQFDVVGSITTALTRAAVRREERAHLSGLTEHVLDLSPYAAGTYFWRWNNRKGHLWS